MIATPSSARLLYEIGGTEWSDQSHPEPMAQQVERKKDPSIRAGAGLTWSPRNMTHHTWSVSIAGRI